MALPAYFTADDVRAIPEDGKRYETVHGKLFVTPAPGLWHQVVIARLTGVLFQYLVRHGLEALLTSPADISWSDDTLVQPDLFVADLDESIRTGRWSDVEELLLVVEVLSPSTGRADRFTKRRLYQEQRIPVYWIVNIDEREIEVWTPDATRPVIERGSFDWRHPALDESVTVDVAHLLNVGPTIH
ncbi:MAG TPA: Uma2 family endonuclease [Gemmatimonadales bacterium]|jgi:Uma2 family endonuclease